MGISIGNGLFSGKTGFSPISGISSGSGLSFSGFSSAFTPLSLFTAGTNGAWYDPSDMSTMFQDAAGTTPVTAVEQPVSRILDKSGRSNHATTPAGATASRPVLSARYNLLTKTEQFDDAVWTKSELVTSGTPPWVDVAIAPDNTTTADFLIPNTSNNNIHYVRSGSITVPNATMTLSFCVKAAGYNYVGILFSNSISFTKYYEAVFNLSNGTIEGTGRSVIYTGANSITNLGNGWYRCSITINSVDANSTSIVQANPLQTNNPTATFAGNGTSGIYIWGADIRVANDGVGIPVYQRVNTSTDYDTTNFPMYLRFDGSDDYMLTGTITPGTDKAQVFAGVRKLVDGASTAALVELSATIDSNNGSFLLGAPASSGAVSYRYFSKGTTSAAFAPETNSTFAAAPNTSVLTGISDISADLVALRRNSSLVGASTADQGTGNFLAYPLYIGRRGGTTLPYNGRLYGMIVRFGANLSATQITNTETWMNGKTKAY